MKANFICGGLKALLDTMCAEVIDVESGIVRVGLILLELDGLVPGGIEAVQISMNKTCFKSFLQESDTLILETLGQEQMLQWLDRLNIEANTWFSAVSDRRA